MSCRAPFFFLSSPLLCLALSAQAATSGAVDRGPLSAVDGATPISVTIVLALPNANEAEDLQQAIYTPGDPQFHHFLTAAQFTAMFAPTDADFSKAIAAFAKYNLTAKKSTASTLTVTGLPADVERAFSVSLHAYEVPASGNVPSSTFHAPVNPPVIPAEVGVPIAGIAGLDNGPAFHPYSKQMTQTIRPAASQPSTGDAPGELTVADFAQHYDVEPLYNKGITGAGRTIGILTLAAFTPTDAFKYWQALGLKVNSNRIQIVNIDGGPGKPSDGSGSIETTLDVEQSGGVAPGANIIVYQAPNTGQGFLDAFARAIDDNTAESLSASWGNWEWLYNYENNPVTDPINGKTVSFTRALHQLLLRAAIQGQSTYASSGDDGAYTANGSFRCLPPYSASDPNTCTLALSVDYPASDPLITAAGGTTLAAELFLCLNQACSVTYEINIEHERVWAWDYFNGFCAAIGAPNPIDCGTFPTGSGGGVSVDFLQPFYQFWTPGVQLSQPDQVFKWPGDPAYDDPPIVYHLPAHFPGRNIPDISFNADPYTGYLIYYTSSVNGYGIEAGWGGTSFVAPQLNGVTALLGQYLGGRIGLLSPTLYAIAGTGQGYRGKNAPLNAIAYGDNWFYHGRDGYNPAAGLGTLDVANFAELLNWYW